MTNSGLEMWVRANYGWIADPSRRLPIRELATFLCIAALLSLWAAVPRSTYAQAAAPCQFVLGFKTLHDMDPGDIGDCLDNQAFAANGDAQQHTTKGLMAWRKVDNWTAFTNGYMTWINGPDGLVSRLNVQRFRWEDATPVLILTDSGIGPNQTRTISVPSGWTLGFTFQCPNARVGCAAFAVPTPVGQYSGPFTQLAEDGAGGTYSVLNHFGGELYIEVIIGAGVPWSLAVEAPPLIIAG